MSPQVSVVVLTLGDRAEALERALASVESQRGVDADVVIVWNGVDTVPVSVPAPDALPTGGVTTRHLHLRENLGIPAGRNEGAALSDGTLVFFLDDDAELIGADVLARAIELFDRDAGLGAVGFRIVDEDGHTAQRHVPRWGGGSAERPGEVTAFLGGAVVIRRNAFEQVGGYAGEFFYAMEETDLAWRLADAGWRIWYAADLRVRHPRTSPARHPEGVHRTARNRVWLVHRLLPVPLALLYLVNWFVLGAVRSPSSIPDVVRGYRDGWRQRVGPRRPIRWSTIVRLSRLGRPPVL